MSEQKFRVYLSGVTSTTVTVTVQTDGLEPDEIRERAVELAHEQNQASLCHQCARHMEPPGEWHAGNWTQQPENLDEYVAPVQ